MHELFGSAPLNSKLVGIQKLHPDAIIDVIGHSVQTGVLQCSTNWQALYRRKQLVCLQAFRSLAA